jgi:rod shape determining protein RodA
LSLRISDLDRVFVATLLVLLVTGVIVVYSSCQGEDPGLGLDFWRKQIVFAVFGLAALALSAAVPPEAWERVSPVMYFVSVAALALVLVAGHSAGGATRWVSVAGIRFQPSELAKLSTVLFLARLLANRKRPPESLRELVVPGLVVLVPMALTLKQPDLGTALVFLSALPPMLYWAGVSVPYLLLASSPALSVVCASSLPSWIAFTVLLLSLAYFGRALVLEKIVFVSLSVVMGIATPILWGHLEDYQQQRIVAFLDPARYSSGAGYQIIQSKVAIGSGGFGGVGFLAGTQKGLAFLPARHTDFIFSVVGEEFGFVGTILVLSLFTLLIVRGYRIAAGSRDPFAGFAAIGILSMLAFQIFVNIGVTVGLVPVTGLPLPIYSYGGTSLLATLSGLGIVLGVGMRRRL